MAGSASDDRVAGPKTIHRGARQAHGACREREGRPDPVPPRQPDLVLSVASFRTANFDFILVTVHIFYGKSKTIKFREDEIKDLAKFIESRAGDQDIYDPDIIALGDFNIVKTGDRFFNALESGGLIVENAIKKLKSNYLKNKHYDQIAYYDYIDSALDFSKAGVVDFTNVVFKEMTSRKLSYALSDHLPLWAEFKIKHYEHEQFLNP